MTMATEGEKLNAKQEAFVREFLLDLNATRAAARAGYSPRTAASQGARLLTNGKVASAISEAQVARAQRTEVTQDRVLTELAVIGFSDIRHFRLTRSHAGLGVELVEGAPDAAMRAVASVKHKVVVEPLTREETHTVEFKFWDKNAALTNCAKHLGMLVEKVDVNLLGRPELRLIGDTVDASDLAALRGKKR